MLHTLLQSRPVWLTLFSLTLMLAIHTSYSQDCSSEGVPPIVNIDFGSGTNQYLTSTPNDFGFTSPNYTQELGPGGGGDGITQDDQFAFVNRIETNWTVWHWNEEDHTPGDVGGYMMQVNSNTQEGVFYRKEVTGLCVGVEYVFSAWMANIYDNDEVAGGSIPPEFGNIVYNVPNVRFTIEDGATTHTFETGDIAVDLFDMTWEEYSITFTAESNSVILELDNLNPGGWGNDLALDDITFTPCLPDYDAGSQVEVCIGADQDLTSTAVTGLFDPAVYQWQELVSGTWQDIPGETDQTFTMTSVQSADAGFYRAIVAPVVANLSNPLCRVVDSVEVTTQQGVTPGEIAANQEICSGDTPTEFTNVTSAANGDGTYTYTWQISTDSLTWSDISGTTGTTNLNYTHSTPLTDSAYFRRSVASGLCPDVPTETVFVQIIDFVDPIVSDVDACQFLEVPRPMATGPDLLWYTGPTGGTGSSVTPVVDSTNAGSTTYYVSASVGDCESSRFPVTATIFPKPELTVNNPEICEGGQATLTSTNAVGSTPYTFTWASSVDLSGTTGNTVVATPSSSTSYTAYVEDNEGCLDTAIATVTVNPRPFITVPDTSFCDSSEVSWIGTLTDGSGGPGNFSWLSSDELETTSWPNLTASPNTTTSYELVYEDANTCLDTAEFVVTVHGKPVLGLAGIQSCPGDTVSFNPIADNASGTVAYNWTPDTYLIDPSVANAQSFAPADQVYRLIIQDENNCLDTAVASHTINSNLTVEVNEDSICPGESVTLTANALGASGTVNYVWSPAASLNVADAVSVEASPLTTTEYSVFATDGNGCGGAGVTTIKVFQKPVLAIAQGETCEGIPDTLPISVTPTTGTYTYSWAPVTGATFTNSTDGPVVITNVSTTTSFTAYVTDQNDCGDTTDFVVTVHPKPEVSVLNDSTCFPLRGTLNSIVSNATGTISYSWTPASTLENANVADAISTATTPATYTLMVQDAEGCRDTTSGTHVVFMKPELQATDATICEGQSGNLTTSVNPPSGTYAYAWNPTADLNSTTLSSVIATPKITTVYTIIAQDENECTDTATATVNVNARPELTVENAVTCEGIPVDAQSTLAPSSGNFTFQPTPPNTGITLQNNPLVVTVNPASTTSYQLIISDNLGCLDTADFTVTVNDKPNATGVPDSTCEGIPANLAVNVTDATGPIQYAWSPASPLNSSNSPSVTSSSSESIIYTIQVEDDNGCRDTTTVTHTVFTKPQISVAPSDVCSGIPSTLVAEIENDNGSPTVTWSPATGLSSTTGITITATPSVTTVYTAIVNDAQNCRDTTEVTVGITDAPIAQQEQGDTLICPGESVALSAFDDGTGNYSFSWYFGTSRTNLTQQSLGVPFEASAEGYYAVEVRNNGFCPLFSDTIFVEQEIISVSANASHETLYFDETLTLTATGSEDVERYEWSSLFGQFTGPVVGLTPTESASYEVTALGERCEASAAVYVNVLPEIIVPNGFSPNGDAKNEAWFIKGLEFYPDAQVFVYNRWGHRVIRFEDGYESPWTGVTENGQELPVATYYYVIEANDERGQVYKGSVTILK